VPQDPAPGDPAAGAAPAPARAPLPTAAGGPGLSNGGTTDRSRAADAADENIELAAASWPPQAAEPGTHPLLQAADAPDAALAEQMLMALDKYRAMAGQRRTDEDGQPSGPFPAQPANP